MKKTKLTRSLLAACSVVALSAVMYGCVHNGGDDAPATDMSGTPDPVPEPMEPAGPTDLEETQTAAADAAAAAMTASDAAAKADDDAATATMYLATLQTGDDSNSDAMGGREAAMAASEAAKDAADAASEAADASAAAAAATTGADAEAALRMALDAQDAAEAAEATAATMAEAALAAAMTELHINGTVKTVGESSIDATMGMLTTPAEVTTDPDIVTGLQHDVEREGSGAVKAQAHSLPDVTPVVQYKQAVEARDLVIGKTLDTTDDKARVTVIHSRAGSKKVSVYALDGAALPNFVVTTIPATPTMEEMKTADKDGTDLTAILPTFKSVGTYYEADQFTPPVNDPTTIVDETARDEPLELDHSDVVAADTKGKEVFSYVEIVDVNGVDTPMTRYVVEFSSSVMVDGNTVVNYQHVDNTAPAAPDSPDGDGDLQQVQVKAAIPMAMEYSHIHFGVWAALGDPDKKTGLQKLTDLGIGFVQSISDDGVTERLGIGTVSYNGDWVAVIQRQNSAGEGAFNMDDGPAKLTADFDKDKFTAALTDLATLEGTLDGNGFSGMTATAISHADLDSSGDFEGEFSGNIYGEKGTEAAGVFDFAGGEAGSFRGAFGGTNQ